MVARLRIALTLVVLMLLASACQSTLPSGQPSVGGGSSSTPLPISVSANIQWFGSRVDGGTWQVLDAPTTTQTVTLPSGDHRFTIAWVCTTSKIVHVTHAFTSTVANALAASGSSNLALSCASPPSIPTYAVSGAVQNLDSGSGTIAFSPSGDPTRVGATASTSFSSGTTTYQTLNLQNDTYLAVLVRGPASQPATEGRWVDNAVTIQDADATFDADFNSAAMTPFTTYTFTVDGLAQSDNDPTGMQVQALYTNMTLASRANGAASLTYQTFPAADAPPLASTASAQVVRAGCNAQVDATTLQPQNVTMSLPACRSPTLNAQSGWFPQVAWTVPGSENGTQGFVHLEAYPTSSSTTTFPWFIQIEDGYLASSTYNLVDLHSLPGWQAAWNPPDAFTLTFSSTRNDGHTAPPQHIWSTSSSVPYP